MKFATLLEVIAHWAEHTPDAVCLIDADCDRKITYAGFWRHIRIFARRLCAMGLQKGDRVVVRVGPLIETFVAQFGVYLAGGVYCPVEKHLKELKLLEMLDYFDSTLLVSSEWAAFDGKWINLADVCAEGAPLEDYTFPKTEDFCAIIFTTGTAGKAKGVMLSHWSSLSFTGMLRLMHKNITAGESFLWTYALERISGIVHCGYAFMRGATLVYRSATIFAEDFFAAINRYTIASIIIPTASLSILLEAAPHFFAEYAGQIRSISFGGSYMPVRQKQTLQKLLPDTRLFQAYGSTEVLHIACAEVSRYGDRPNCVGEIYGDVEVSFVDESGEPVRATAQQPGIIVVGNNKSIMLGYWKDSELTAQTVKDGSIVMTDLGYIGEDGLLYVLGRKDDVIVCGGRKIAPYEIEETAGQIPGVRECACAAVRDKVMGQIPVLFVVMRGDAAFNAKGIYSALESRLESWKLPRAIRRLDALPRTTDGLKINREVLSSYE